MNLRWMIGWMAVVVTAGALRAAMTAGAAERLAARMIEQEPALKMAFGGHKVAEAEVVVPARLKAVNRLASAETSTLDPAAREAGFTADFGVLLRRGQGPAEEPSGAEVNRLMRCFKGLNFEAAPAAGVMTLGYDFRVSTLAFVTVADEPSVVVGVVVESGGREAAFGEAAQFTLNARGAINARATTQAGAVEVTDATGQTEGRSAAAGQRYFRLPLTETGTSGFFSVSVFSEEVSE